MRQIVSPDNGSEVMEFALPDYEQLKAEFAFVFETRDARLRILDAYVASDADDETERMEIVSRRMNSVEVKLNGLPGPRILLFLDAHYPGWHAYLDDKEAPILLANDAFKAIVVPEGTHHVRFVFRPKSVYIGMAVSALALVGASAYCLTYLALARRRKDRAVPGSRF
jgi:hypothetical protein